jgi:hypothetical protein
MKRALKIINYAPYVDVEDFVLQGLEMAWNHALYQDSFDADVRVDFFYESLKRYSSLHVRPLDYYFEMDLAVE